MNDGQSRKLSQRAKMAIPLPARKRLGAVRRALTGVEPQPRPDLRVQELVSVRSISPEPLSSAPVSDILYARLTEADLDAIRAALTPEQTAYVASGGEADGRRALLPLGVAHRVPAVAKTGLTEPMPPDDVHAMGRGELAAGGVIYYADLVVEALATVGLQPAAGSAALDFGCSSGRVVRVLAAAYPEIEWHGCDPIADAIEWASANLPAIDFVNSPTDPPLPYRDGNFDFVYAISIWSHFGEEAALEWLGEMRRIIRPGGALVLTTHGYHSIAFWAQVGGRGPGQLSEIEDALYRDGFWFKQEFGDDGDHGIKRADWGTAFQTPEWMLKQLRGEWDVCGFWPGMSELNQDVYALRRI